MSQRRFSVLEYQNRLENGVNQFTYFKYSVNVRFLHLAGLFIYFVTILSRRTKLKNGTRYFFVIAFVLDILILQRYCIISAEDICKL